jgi:murein DD-endopeptidase MepM/ murein hydrolase activator NlpD
MIRSHLRAAVGVGLLCGSLASAAFMAMPTRMRGATQHYPRSTTALPLPTAGATPASTQFTELADSLARDVDRLTSIPSVLPTVGRLASRFAPERHHPILRVTRPHKGIDIAAPFGAPVVAPAAGVVVTIATEMGYGLLLELDHGHGVITKYGHLSRARVRVGQVVTRGELLGDVGSSGLSTGPHLHYEVRMAGKVVDPLLFGP